MIHALLAAALVWVIGVATVFPLLDRLVAALPGFDFTRASFAVTLVLFAVCAGAEGKIWRRCGGVELAMLAYAGIALLSWTTTLAAKDSLALKRDLGLILTSLAMPFAAFVIARHSGWTNAQRTKAMYLIVLVASLFLVITGLIQSIFDWSFMVAPEARAMHRNRARGAFSNAVEYSLLLAMLLLGAMAWLASRDSSARKASQVTASTSVWVALVLVLCLCQALILGRLRIVWLALPTALAVVAWLHPRLRRHAMAVAALFFLMWGLGALRIDATRFATEQGAARQNLGSVAGRVMDSEPLLNRIAVYATALNMIGDRPLFGFGYAAGTFDDRKARYYTSCCGVAAHWAEICRVPHNELLNQMVWMGAIGLAAYLFLVMQIWRDLGKPRPPRLSALAAITRGCFVLIAVTGLLHDVTYLEAPQLVFYFFAGLVSPARELA